MANLWVHRDGYRWLGSPAERSLPHETLEEFAARYGVWLQGRQLLSSVEAVDHFLDGNPSRLAVFQPFKREWQLAQILTQFRGPYTDLLVVDDKDPDGELLGREVDAMAHSGLHRRFAALSTSRDVLAFANEYGHLGPHLDFFDSPSHREGPDVGEPLEAWAQEITLMRLLVQLWDSVRSPVELGELKRILTVKTNDSRIAVRLNKDQRDVFPGTLSIESPITYIAVDDLPPTLSDSDRLALVTRAFLEAQVNAGLARCNPRVVAKHGSTLKLYANDLHAALYASFAQDVMGAAPSTALCAVCGKWFIPQHGRQMYCDDRCKFKAYRQRKKETQ